MGHTVLTAPRSVLGVHGVRTLITVSASTVPGCANQAIRDTAVELVSTQSCTVMISIAIA